MYSYAHQLHVKLIHAWTHSWSSRHQQLTLTRRHSMPRIDSASATRRGLHAADQLTPILWSEKSSLTTSLFRGIYRKYFPLNSARRSKQKSDGPPPPGSHQKSDYLSPTRRGFKINCSNIRQLIGGLPPFSGRYCTGKPPNAFSCL